MRERPSSRLLILDATGRLLLFRFQHKTGPLAGQAFWATPGGGLNPGETYEDAACRELLEETGLRVQHPGPQIAQRTAVFQMPDGDMVTADERFFHIGIDRLDVSFDRWTELEREVMVDHRWWSPIELMSTKAQVWPEDLADMLVETGLWPQAAKPFAT